MLQPGVAGEAPTHQVRRLLLSHGRCRPLSGAHFNPILSAVNAWKGQLTARDCGVYVLAQVCGAFAGVAAAHAMFGLPIVQISQHVRPTLGEGLGKLSPRSVSCWSFRLPRDLAPTGFP